MQAKDAIRHSLDMSDRIIDAYINDLDDADLLVRPVPGMNHIAWQLGHLILTERGMVEMIRPGTSPELPEGFERGHGRESFGEDDPARFFPRARYQELWKAQREATRRMLDGLSEADLDAPAPERFQRMGPTVGHTLSLAGNHALMHCGQFVAVRRALGKPVAI